jgi:hypothetical protein
MTDDGRRVFLVGGMDAGIEALLLDAGGMWLEPPEPTADPPGPWVGFAFATGRRPAVAVMLRVCRDHGWTVREGGVGSSATTAWVQEMVAVRVLHRLVRDGAAPEAVVIDNADLSPAQIRGLREALPAGTSLGIIGGSRLSDRP